MIKCRSRLDSDDFAVGTIALTGKQVERLLIVALGVAMTLGSLGIMVWHESVGAQSHMVSRLLILTSLVGIGLALSGPFSGLDRAIERLARDRTPSRD